MPSIGNLVVTIGANTQPLREGLREADTTISGTSRAMRGLITSAGLLAASAGAAGAAIVAGLVKSGTEAISTQYDLAKSLDGTISGLRAAEMAAGDAGVATDAFYDSASKLNAKLGEATTGVGASAEALKGLGLNAKTLMSMDIDQRFAAISDRMRDMNLSGGQAQAIMRDLGIKNAELANLMRQGGDAFREQAEEVKNLGLALSMVDASKVKEAQNSLGIFGDVLTGIQDRMAVVAAPYITVLAERFRSLAIENKGFESQISKTIKSIINGFGMAADVVQGLGVVFQGIKVIALGFGAAALSILEAQFSAIEWLGDKTISLINDITGSNIALPSSSEFSKSIHKMANDVRDSVGIAVTELDRMSMAEMNSEKVKRFMADVDLAMTKTAQLKEGAGNIGGFGDLPDPPEKQKKADDETKRQQEEYQKQMEAWNEKNATELEAVKNRYMTEEQLNSLHREEMLIIGETYDAQKFESEEQWRKIKEQSEAEHLQRIQDMNRSAYDGIQGIIESRWGKNVASVGGALKSILGTMAVNSRKAFELSKAWAMSDALISTYQGIAKGVSKGWAGAGEVAWAAATGFAQVSAIRQQSFGGAGGAAASGNGTPATAPNPVGVGGSTENQGGRYYLEGIDPSKQYSGASLLETLKQMQKDGAFRGNLEFA